MLHKQSVTGPPVGQSCPVKQGSILGLDPLDPGPQYGRLADGSVLPAYPVGTTPSQIMNPHGEPTAMHGTVRVSDPSVTEWRTFTGRFKIRTHREQRAFSRKDFMPLNATPSAGSADEAQTSDALLPDVLELSPVEGLHRVCTTLKATDAFAFRDSEEDEQDEPSSSSWSLMHFYTPEPCHDADQS
jgi:hypothetical protein